MLTSKEIEDRKKKESAVSYPTYNLILKVGHVFENKAAADAFGRKIVDSIVDAIPQPRLKLEQCRCDYHSGFEVNTEITDGG